MSRRWCVLGRPKLVGVGHHVEDDLGKLSRGVGHETSGGLISKTVGFSQSYHAEVMPSFRHLEECIAHHTEPQHEHAENADEGGEVLVHVVHDRGDVEESGECGNEETRNDLDLEHRTLRETGHQKRDEHELFLLPLSHEGEDDEVELYCAERGRGNVR
eukprot:CAMPEP_0175987924 /NCGR_PEP_ID=MMETSP0108-20121206/50969_1 /TAXON_ID=195067 ORGANISM="Goniomonas pacifica, Strain CCMP1869" /NCGR_SAMPLE_ID=MMETSP0108 /ASSEMBLY_ACC=CAM_ASM_000204 /LENGTH=158 /DNA_ID=CAMNT_0017319235 /DNA_START=130 /DNA_END=606 /DNA_ORIENTATION=+